MSSFWFICKQQWTIKITSPFFLFLAWRPSWLEDGITDTILEGGSSKDHSTKVWFKLAKWLQRSWLKCEKLTDGQTLSGDNSSPDPKGQVSYKDHSFTWKSIPTPKKWDHSHTFLSWPFRDVKKIFLHTLRGTQGLSKAEMTFVGQFTCLNNFGINILI